MSFAHSPRPTCDAGEAAADTDVPDLMGEATVHTSPAGDQTACGAALNLTGTWLGDFEVLEELGRGGMGIVYKARQQSLNRMVALKVLPADALYDTLRAARFQQEARAVAALSHPNIVSVHQLGYCQAGRYLVMDYVAGPSLETMVRRGRLPLSWVVSVMIVVAEAIHHAHSRGVLHRDLKPANVLLEGGRRPVIIDFGLARFMRQDSSLTQEGTIMGSPSYMAPEQAGKDNEPVGPASDIYSLGAVLYALLTGRAPYDEGSFLKTVLKVVAPEMPPAMRSLAPHVPADLERICTKCLCKTPAGRYPTARALADDLRRCRARLKS